MGSSRLVMVPGLDRIITAETAGFTGLVIGGGGMGKTRVLDALADRATEAGLTVRLETVIASGDNLPDLDAGDPDIDLLLVDDAQFLRDDAFAELLAVAEDRDRSFNLCIATRPVAGHRGLGRLIEVTERRGILHELGPYSKDELGAALSEGLDAAVDVSLFAAALKYSSGHPLIVDRLLAGWIALDHIDRGRLRDHPEIAPVTVERALRGPVQQLDQFERALLAAMALGMQSAGVGAGKEHLHALQSHGLVLADGSIPLSVAKAVKRMLEPADLERGERLLVDELTRGGADAIRIAEQYAELNEPGDQARAAWIAAGDSLLDSNPRAAGEWYLQAQHAGRNGIVATGAGSASDATALETIAKYAVACAAADDEAAANHAISAVLRTEPRNPRTLGAGAQIAARHGRWNEVADLISAIDEHPRWSPGVVRVLTRGADLLAERRTSGERPTVATDPTASMLDTAFTALEISLEHIPETLKLTEAVRELATRVGAPPGGADLPLNAFELGAVAAVAVGELDMAEVLLDSAQPAAAHGPHSALHNWLRVRTGGQPDRTVDNNHTSDKAASDKAASDNAASDKAASDNAPNTSTIDAIATSSDSPYAGLLNLAASALHARRNGDVAASSDVLDRLRNVVALAPIDVLTFDAAAELMILARRFGSRTVLHTIEERLERFLTSNGNPPLWRVRVHWAEIEAAVGSRNIDLARQAATALKEIGPTGPRLTALVEASAIWIEVLEERCTVETVLATAVDLENSGFSNEASLLVGQAAIRMSAPSDARQLLNRARELRGAGTTAVIDLNSPSGLSEREIEVADLILDGHSYKEIGSRLFISAKTVEHHSSHIRQKLDAVGAPRAVFLAALRADLQR